MQDRWCTCLFLLIRQEGAAFFPELTEPARASDRPRVEAARIRERRTWEGTGGKCAAEQSRLARKCVS